MILKDDGALIAMIVANKPLKDRSDRFDATPRFLITNSSYDE